MLRRTYFTFQTKLHAYDKTSFFSLYWLTISLFNLSNYNLISIFFVIPVQTLNIMRKQWYYFSLMKKIFVWAIQKLRGMIVTSSSRIS